MQYKTAFVLSHKLREALAAEKANATVSGEVAVDGAYFGGHVRPANHRENRVDRRLAVNQTGKRRVVVIAREKNGKTLPFVFKTEPEALATLGERIEIGSTVHADEATHWDALHSRYLTKRINHQEAYSADGACTNDAESFFSRLRRSEIGIHHHISGRYLVSLRARNGVARGQPAPVERRTISNCRQCRVGASRKPTVEGVLATLNLRRGAHRHIWRCLARGYRTHQFSMYPGRQRNRSFLSRRRNTKRVCLG